MKAIGYVRVSTADQATSGLGLEAQRESIARCAAGLGAEVGGVFADEGVSGSVSIEGRPGLLAAVGELRRGDVLLVAKRDRLGRDVVAVALLERLVARKGARIVSAAGEGTADDDPGSILMRRLLDAFAEHERLLIGARTKAALRAKRARGERAGNVPWGFRALEDGRLVEEPREVEVARLAAELRRDGLTVSEVEVALRDRGVRGRNGLPLGRSRVGVLVQGVAS